MLSHAQTFSRDGSSQTAEAVAADIDLISQESLALSESQPQAATQFASIVGDLETGFATLRETRQSRDTAAANLDTLTSELVATTNKASRNTRPLPLTDPPLPSPTKAR